VIAGNELVQHLWIKVAAGYELVQHLGIKQLRLLRCKAIE